MDKICKLCNNTNGSTRLVKHHLSYDPELLVCLCYKCHAALHSMAVIPLENQLLMMEWIKQYGTEWINCNEKYKKSKHYQDLMRIDGHVLSKEYKDKWKKQHPEKIKQYAKKQSTKRKGRWFSDPKYREWQRQYQKEYRKTHKEQLNASVRKYRANHLEEVRTRDREHKREKSKLAKLIQSE